jgi:hypothetical protein
MQFTTLFIVVFAAVAFAAPEREARSALVGVEQLLEDLVRPDLWFRTV